MKLFSGVFLCGGIGLALFATGCSDNGGSGAPPTKAQVQQQVYQTMNDPHVPDAVKQHLRDQQQARQQAASGYTAQMKLKQAAHK